MTLTLQPGLLTLAQLRDIHTNPQTLVIDPAATAGIRASAALVQKPRRAGMPSTA